MSKYIAAVVQAGSYSDEPLKSASKAADLIREAAARGARLAVFPEAFIGGYPKGASFGAPIGLRKPEGREAFRRYYEAAIDLNGDAVNTIAAGTADTGVFAAVGCIDNRDLCRLREHGEGVHDGGAISQRNELAPLHAPPPELALPLKASLSCSNSPQQRSDQF